LAAIKGVGLARDLPRRPPDSARRASGSDSFFGSAMRRPLALINFVLTSGSRLEEKSSWWLVQTANKTLPFGQEGLGKAGKNLRLKSGRKHFFRFVKNAG
jgi:hypothetical protein